MKPHPKKGTFCFFPTVSRKKQNVPFSQRGWSYVEVLVATVLIAIALAPALEAMQTSLLGADIHEQNAINVQRLSSRLEEVLAQPFSDLDAAAAAAGGPTTATTYSDGVGTQDRRLVFLSRYDGDNADADNDPFTGTDAGLIWIKVEIENTVMALETLINE